VYGNYVGPGYSGGTTKSNPDFSVPPIDRLDTIARTHDLHYETLDESIADAEMVWSLIKLGFLTPLEAAALETIAVKRLLGLELGSGPSRAVPSPPLVGIETNPGPKRGKELINMLKGLKGSSGNTSIIKPPKPQRSKGKRVPKSSLLQGANSTDLSRRSAVNEASATATSSVEFGTEPQVSVRRQMVEGKMEHVFDFSSSHLICAITSCTINGQAQSPGFGTTGTYTTAVASFVPVDPFGAGGYAGSVVPNVNFAPANSPLYNFGTTFAKWRLKNLSLKYITAVNATLLGDVTISVIPDEVAGNTPVANFTEQILSTFPDSMILPVWGSGTLVNINQFDPGWKSTITQASVGTYAEERWSNAAIIAISSANATGITTGVTIGKLKAYYNFQFYGIGTVGTNGLYQPDPFARLRHLAQLQGFKLVAIENPSRTPASSLVFHEDDDDSSTSSSASDTVKILGHYYVKDSLGRFVPMTTI